MSIESEKRENSRKRKIQIKFYVDEDELKYSGKDERYAC